MDTRKSVPDEAFRNAATMFGVKDVERAAGFYRDSLGFTVRNIWKDIGPYAIVNRGGVEIHFFERDTEEGHEGDCIYIKVEDADAVFEEMKGMGHTDVNAPEDRPYGMRDFGLQDLDGHRLYFGSRTADA